MTSDDALFHMKLSLHNLSVDELCDLLTIAIRRCDTEARTEVRKELATRPVEITLTVDYRDAVGPYTHIAAMVWEPAEDGRGYIREFQIYSTWVAFIEDSERWDWKPFKVEVAECTVGVLDEGPGR